MVSAHQGGLVFVKGAPEEVLALCSHELQTPLDENARREILCRNQILAERALRVLALGWRKESEPAFRDLGLVGLRDPVRPGAAEAVAGARKAGIRTLTSPAIRGRPPPPWRARWACRAHAGGGRGGARRRRCPRPGRPVPRYPRRQTGAGGAPARARRDCGHGRRRLQRRAGLEIGRYRHRRGDPAASELSRQVADVLLTDADLRTILAAVAEGRIVQDNLRRAIRYLFATNLSELALVLGASAAGLPSPLTPLMLLFINLLTDTLPALALAWEPGDADVLARPPAPPEAPLIDDSRRILRDGLGLAALGAAGAVVGGRALSFGVLAGAQLAYTAACRAPDAPRGNGLGRVLGGSVALQSLALLTPGSACSAWARLSWRWEAWALDWPCRWCCAPVTKSFVQRASRAERGEVLRRAPGEADAPIQRRQDEISFSLVRDRLCRRAHHRRRRQASAAAAGGSRRRRPSAVRCRGRAPGDEARRPARSDGRGARARVQRQAPSELH